MAARRVTRIAVMPPDRRLALAKYRWRAPVYDLGAVYLDPIRRRAIDKLRLRRGEVVLDVGCGTGLSFPLIEDGIGPEGRVIGIELSPEMAARARQRVEDNAWKNVTLLESAVEDAEIHMEADAVLFCFTHDITRSLPALENVFRQVRAGGRMAAAGAKWAPWWTGPLNFYLWLHNRRFVTTFEGFARPWSYLEHFVPGLEVERLGGVYLAWGAVPAR